MSRLTRGAFIVFVVLRYGLDELVLSSFRHPWLRRFTRILTLGRNLSAPRGERLREALERLGPIFVKFGQVLSTRRDLLPADVAQELGIARVANALPHGLGLAMGIEINRQSSGVQVRAQFTQQAMQAGAHGKAVFSQADGGAHQVCPGQAAMRLMQLPQQRHQTWHAHRLGAARGLVKVHGLSIHHELLGVGCGGCGFASIVGAQALAIHQDHECTTPRTAGLGLDQPQHPLGSNGRIHRIAAGRQQYLDGFHIGFDNWHSTDGLENHQLSQDIYRRLRNTLRYLLGALDGFTKAEQVAVADMPELER